MEERGHLGKKYEGESQESSADLWGRIEPKIERKRRPFGLLWWLGIGGTILLFVGLWKAGTDTVVPISTESKSAVHTKESPKSSQPVEKQAMAQNQTSQSKPEVQSLNENKLPENSETKTSENKTVKNSHTNQSNPNPVAKSLPKPVYKTKTEGKVQVQNPKPTIPYMAKSEDKAEKKSIDENAKSENEEKAGLKTTPVVIKTVVVAALVGLDESPSKKESPSTNENPVQAESLVVPPSDPEPNSPTIPPSFELKTENVNPFTVDSVNHRINMDLALNSFINPETKVQEDTSQKKLKTDSLTVQASDTSHKDSTRLTPLKNWKLGFSIGGFYTTKNMTINQNPEENRVEVVNKNAFSSDRFAWSAAFWFEKSIRSQLSWYASLGVLFIQDQTDLKVQTDTVLGFSERTDAYGNKFLKPVYGEWNRSVQTRKLFLEAQVGISFSRLFGPMGFKIGPGINYLLWDDRKITEMPARTGTEPTSTSQVLPSIHMGLPFSWNLGRGQNLVVEPAVSYFLSPVFHPYSGADIKPFLAGLKVGFSW